MSVTVEPLPHPMGAEAVAWLSAQVNRQTAWDLSLSREDHGKLLVTAVNDVARSGRGWLARDGNGVAGIATLEPLPWDTDHFGIPMHRLSHLLLGGDQVATGRALLTAIVEEAVHQGVAHIQHALDADQGHTPLSGGEALTTMALLQAHGFQVRWSALRVIRHVTAEAVPAGGHPDVQFGVAGPEHLATLSEVTGRLAPYNWLEVDPTLPPAPRRTYVRERLRGCIETDFADLCLVATHRGRALGFNASKLMAHGDAVDSTHRWSYERDTFVAPEAPPGLGAMLVREAVNRLSSRIRYIRGRIRINGVAMLRVVRRSGYDVEGGDFMLTWAKEDQA